MKMQVLHKIFIYTRNTTCFNFLNNLSVVSKKKKHGTTGF